MRKRYSNMLDKLNTVYFTYDLLESSEVHWKQKYKLDYNPQLMRKEDDNVQNNKETMERK